jgi:hypothetical protein
MSNLDEEIEMALAMFPSDELEVRRSSDAADFHVKIQRDFGLLCFGLRAANGRVGVDYAKVGEKDLKSVISEKSAGCESVLSALQEILGLSRDLLLEEPTESNEMPNEEELNELNPVERPAFDAKCDSIMVKDLNEMLPLFGFSVLGNGTFFSKELKLHLFLFDSEFSTDSDDVHTWLAIVWEQFRSREWNARMLIERMKKFIEEKEEANRRADEQAGDGDDGDDSNVEGYIQYLPKPSDFGLPSNGSSRSLMIYTYGTSIRKSPPVDSQATFNAAVCFRFALQTQPIALDSEPK